MVYDLFKRPQYLVQQSVEHMLNQMLKPFKPAFMQLWKENLEKNSGLNGIRTHDLWAMPVQCSTIWAIKPTGSWSYCEFVTTRWGLIKEYDYMRRNETGTRVLYFTLFVGIEFGTSLAAVRRRAREYGEGIGAFWQLHQTWWLPLYWGHQSTWSYQGRAGFH